MQLTDFHDRRREDVERLRRNAPALALSRAARQRLEWFLYALDHDDDVAAASAAFAISASTFRRWLKRFDPENPQSLEEKSRRPHALREPDTLPEVIELIRQYRLRFPTMGKERIAAALVQEHNVALSPSTIGRVIARERFFFAHTLSHLHKRGTVPPEHGGSTGLGGIVTGLLLTVASFATFFAGAARVEAAESASFQLYGVFPNETTESPAASTSFTLNEGGTTWTGKPLVGTSFQIVTAPPASSSSSAASASSEAEAPTQGGGGRRGRHPTIPPPRTPERPKPAAPAEEPEKLPRPERPRREEELLPVPPGEQLPLAVPPVLPGFVPAERPADFYRFFEAVDPLCPVCLLPPPPALERRPEEDIACPQVPEAESVRPAAPAALAAPGATAWIIGLSLFLLGLVVGIGTYHLYRTIRANDTGNGGRKKKKARWHLTSALLLRVLVTLAAGAALFLLAQRAGAATTVPNMHVYNGHLLNSAGAAITTSHNIRFSYWKSADHASTDTTATGAIHAGAGAYANWYEVHTVTPDSNGYFSVRLGSGTSLPSLASFTAAELQSLYLQVEVKSASAADTSYELLDVDGNNTAVDRSPVLSVPFALNADRVDQRDVGTGSGSIPFLQTGGLLPVSAIPDGTNANAFIIDKDGTSSTDITLTFGGALAKRLWYDAATTRFTFDDDLHTTGNFTASGTLKVAGAATFGSTLNLNGVTYAFPTSDGAASGKVLKTDSTGQLSWSDDSTGAGGSKWTDGGTFLYVTNGENVILGSTAAPDTRLEIIGTASGRILHAQDELRSSGSLAVEGAAAFGSTIQLNGVAYTFPTSDGAGSGKILKTNGAGQLTWGSAGRSSGASIGLRPAYPNVAYFGSGAAAIGTLSLRYSSGSEVTNHYRWQSTKATNQHQWISTQIRLPDTFSTWEASKPVELRYRTNSGYITAYMLDTNDAPVTLSGNMNLRSSTWTTATITGPNTSGTWTAGDTITVLLRLTNSGATLPDKTFTDVGALTVNIEESLP